MKKSNGFFFRSLSKTKKLAFTESLNTQIFEPSIIH